MKKTSTYRVSTYKICIVAFAICINLSEDRLLISEASNLPGQYRNRIHCIHIRPDLWNASECDQWSVHGNDG